MSDEKRRCFRCRGQKKMFRVGGAYSLMDTGGQEVKCPLCRGEGFINIPKNVSEIKVEEKKDLTDDKERVEAKETDSKERAEKPKKRKRKTN